MILAIRLIRFATGVDSRNQAIIRYSGERMKSQLKNSFISPKKGYAGFRHTLLNSESDRISVLFADTEFFLGDDCAIAVDVLADQIVEQAATLTYKRFQCACCGIVFVIGLQMLCQVLDTH